jgi:hypothetical protein
MPLLDSHGKRYPFPHLAFNPNLLKNQGARALVVVKLQALNRLFSARILI